jgi:hypothetical protein
MDRGHDQIASDGGGYRGGTHEVPLQKCMLAHQVGVQLFPKTLADPGGMIQEPIPEDLVKFVI